MGDRTKADYIQLGVVATVIEIVFRVDQGKLEHIRAEPYKGTLTAQNYCRSTGSFYH